MAGSVPQGLIQLWPRETKGRYSLIVHVPFKTAKAVSDTMRFCRVDGQSARWSMLSALTEKA